MASVNVIYIFVATLLIFVVESHAQAPQAPKYPVWPTQFTVTFDVKVPSYGPSFIKKGALFYDYSIQTARADYYDWCIPLFGKRRSTEGLYNVTCSFLMTANAAYFISPDFEVKEDRCCLFGQIPPPTPDWLKNTDYNTTEWLRGHYADKWYFPGTDNPEDPYYIYWDDHYTNDPVRFYGLASIGVTILDYTSYQVGPIKNKSIFKLPSADCETECVSPPSDFLDPFLAMLKYKL